MAIKASELGIFDELSSWKSIVIKTTREIEQ
jgi:hypothetical protein